VLIKRDVDFWRCRDEYAITGQLAINYKISFLLITTTYGIRRSIPTTTTISET